MSITTDIEVIIMESISPYNMFQKEIRLAKNTMSPTSHIYNIEHRVDIGTICEFYSGNDGYDWKHSAAFSHNGTYHRKMSTLPSDYSYTFYMESEHETSIMGIHAFSLRDNYDCPHGICIFGDKKSKWCHGCPITPHKMHLYNDISPYEDYDEDNGRVYFSPLKDGYYLVDYYYIHCGKKFRERMFNIYRIDPTSSVGFVFKKYNNHTFHIEKNNYSLKSGEYFVPVSFVFQYHQMPTEDDVLFERQKKAALAFIDAQELPSEEYDKSAHHYNDYMEYYKKSIMENIIIMVPTQTFYME